ncbi:photosystem II reaction center W protein, chloroplastic [Magnolia sinica]|uniref:photosystem II reaction center W protein, chloroplastic n=1 Tax=Magnolia sinica TaxID=86752 RepID=UPI0026596CE3|nr:photosystem II reaction center W protein, chloroplastic [Magnolia sinica]
MATITASTPTSSIAATAVARKRAIGASPSPVLGLPAMAMKGRVRCSVEEKPSVGVNGTAVSMGASLMAATCAATVSSPAWALVDERMTTEGTGLSLGVSNNLLGWILLGVFALIWALFFIYTSTLEEDEESGLSL